MSTKYNLTRFKKTIDVHGKKSNTSDKLDLTTWQFNNKLPKTILKVISKTIRSEFKDQPPYFCIRDEMKVTVSLPLGNGEGAGCGDVEYQCDLEDLLVSAIQERADTPDTMLKLRNHLSRALKLADFCIEQKKAGKDLNIYGDWWTEKQFRNYRKR